MARHASSGVLVWPGAVHHCKLGAAPATLAWRLDASIDSDDLRQARAEVEQLRGSYLTDYKNFEALVRDGNMTQAKLQLINGLRNAQLAYMGGLDKFTELNEGLMSAAAKQADSTVNTGVWIVSGLGLGATLFALVLTHVISRTITVPLAQALEIAQTVAQGDLRSRFEVRGNDEAAKLLHALRDMNESLVGIVGSVRSASESIATGSSEIANGNSDLSQRTEEQASNLQQTAASMEQLKTTVANNADRSRDAAKLAQGASEVASQGGAAMREVVQTMEEISASSRKIPSRAYEVRLYTRLRQPPVIAMSVAPRKRIRPGTLTAMAPPG